MGRFSSDFEKAFDKVIYLFIYLRKLISKLHTYGLHVSIINWICGSLETRKHRAKDNISYSGWNNVISGVLRGNILGRLLTHRPYYVRTCGLLLPPSSVVCWSVSLSHKWTLQKRLNRSRCRLGWGLGWAQGTMYLDGGPNNFGGRRAHCTYRDFLPWAMQERLNGSICRLDCGLGWA